jgi:hypothetical protein
MMKLLFGPDGTLKTYVAPADEHTVVMAYTSLDRLKAALEFYRSGKPGLSADASLAKVAATLPSGSQFVNFVSLGGTFKLVQQFAASMPGARPPAMPDFPDCPPLGMAAKVSPTGFEGHLTITAETLQTIGDFAAKVRGAVPAGVPPQ